MRRVGGQSGGVFGGIRKFVQVIGLLDGPVGPVIDGPAISHRDRRGVRQGGHVVVLAGTCRRPTGQRRESDGFVVSATRASQRDNQYECQQMNRLRFFHIFSQLKSLS